MLLLPIYIVVFLYGIVIGSFLNVCIYRIPAKESIVRVRSHCMSCGYQLKWYDLIPLFSYVFLRGRCRKCRARISAQYPIVEGVNGLLYVLIFLLRGISIDSLLCCMLVSFLIAISVIDFRTYEIPWGFDICILVLGLIRLCLHLQDWYVYVIGFFAVSVPLLLIYAISKGRALGGGDVKLMAVCGLFLGWKLVVVGFFAGCILGAVIHLLRMRISHAAHVLALGPYLSAGVFLAMLWGDAFLRWYLGLMGL